MPPKGQKNVAASAAEGDTEKANKQQKSTVTTRQAATATVDVTKTGTDDMEDKSNLDPAGEHFMACGLVFL